MKKSYKNIEFAEGLNIPFADFKERFQSVKVFRDMKPEVRSKELKVAHKKACPLQYVKDIKVKDVKVIDGNTKPAVKKSRKSNTRKDSK